MYPVGQFPGQRLLLESPLNVVFSRGLGLISVQETAPVCLPIIWLSLS